jgi:preprotein translocase subunit SecE
MAAGTEVKQSGLDALKLLVAVAIIAAGVAGFYLFEEYPLVLRVLAFLLLTGAGIFVALQSTRGRAIREFLLDSRTEVRKVVWPSRHETVQTTLIVFGVVIAMAIFLWLVDLVLLEIVKAVTGQGG